jgi:hypothetical protein
MRLIKVERETIIDFNEGEDTASVYTCNKQWMKHMEQKLHLEPFRTYGDYAREYLCPKSWIRKPQKPRQLSQVQRDELSQRLRQQSNLRSKIPSAVGDSGGDRVG